MFDSNWFPAAESRNVVGRVVEVEKLHAAKSREANEPVYILVPVMETKVLKDSSDISHQEIKEQNKAEFKKITSRFPGAWEAYVKAKEAKGETPHQEQVLPSIKGTPLEEALKFMNRVQVSRLKLIGFTTVEQIAEMSDEQVGSLGPGARNWRKKAQAHLKG